MDALNMTAEEPVRIFQAWREKWEDRKIGPNVNIVFEARLAQKYEGIQWFDPDNAYTRCTAHPNRMLFEKRHGNNTYHVLACKDTYDYDIEDPELQDAEWDVWGHEKIL